MLPLWAIMPNQIDRLLQLYQKRLEFYSKGPEIEKQTSIHEGVNVTTTRFSSLLNGDMTKDIPPTFEIINGVGILPIEGIIIPKADMFSLIFGGFATLDILTRDFLELKDRDDVHTILLDIDSPGGSAFGVQQFANIIFNARSNKTIISVTSGIMASAAMWIGAAAHKIIITGDVTVTGSIGTVTSHVDISEAEKMAGIKTTEVVAGEFKREPSSFAPLTEKGRAVLQDQVNHANSAFVAGIAKFKDVPLRTVTSKMAEGKIFIGTQGIQVGLIDDMMTMDQILADVTDKNSSMAFIDRTKTFNFNLLKGGNGMTILEQIAKIKEDNHGLYEAIVNIGKAESEADYKVKAETEKKEAYQLGLEAGKTEGMKEGAKAETSRIASLKELATVGNQQMIDRFILDGKTTAPEAAVEILKAQKVSNANGLVTLQQDAPKALDMDVVDDEADNGKKGLQQLVAEYMAEHKCTKGVAIIACAKLYPNAKNDFVASAKKGQ
jgi:signal peptide peptidase SppA